MSDQAKFLEGNLLRHITVMSVTSSVGLMAIFVVDLVDMIFIAMLGNAALAAAVGYAGAILFFTTSFGIGMAIAAGALVARALGAGDETLAKQRSSSAMIYGILFGAVFSWAVWFNIPFLLGLMGAGDETLPLAAAYLKIIIPTLPLLMIGMLGGAILRSHGDAGRSMYATLSGGIVNAVLDPILIFGFGLDLQGAAWASVAARCSIAVFAVVPIIRHHGGFIWPGRAMLADFQPLAIIAVPAILTQLATPIGQAYVTRAMADFGEAAVAGMAMVGRITPVAFGIIFALSGAIGPIIGQNNGAGLTTRVQETFRQGLIFTAFVTIIVAALLFALRAPLAVMFQAEGQARDLLYLFCGPLALLFFFNGVLFVANAAFNNLGRPFYATWINWGRHTLGTIGFVWLLQGNMGPEGVLIGQALGGVLFGVLAYVLAQRVIGKPAEDALKHDTYARQARLFALFSLRK